VADATIVRVLALSTAVAVSVTVARLVGVGVLVQGARAVVVARGAAEVLLDGALVAVIMTAAEALERAAMPGVLANMPWVSGLMQDGNPSRASKDRVCKRPNSLVARRELEAAVCIWFVCLLALVLQIPAERSSD